MSGSSNFHIVKAGPQDAERVRGVVRAAYAKWVPVIGREPLPMTVDYARAMVEHEIDLVCEGEALLAVIELFLRAEDLFVENLAVAPSCQGRGLGRMLLRHAEEKARLAGRRRVSLLTNAAFVENVRFYEKMGFRVDRTEPFRGGTTVYMSKAVG